MSSSFSISFETVLSKAFTSEQTPEGLKKKISTMLENGYVRDAVKRWIPSHEKFIIESPLMDEIFKKIYPLKGLVNDPFQNSSAIVPLVKRVINFTHTKFTPQVVELERIILTKAPLLPHFKQNPEFILNHLLLVAEYANCGVPDCKELLTDQSHPDQAQLLLDALNNAEENIPAYCNPNVFRHTVPLLKKLDNQDLKKLLTKNFGGKPLLSLQGILKESLPLLGRLKFEDLKQFLKELNLWDQSLKKATFADLKELQKAGMQFSSEFIKRWAMQLPPKERDAALNSSVIMQSSKKIRDFQLTGFCDALALVTKKVQTLDTCQEERKAKIEVEIKEFVSKICILRLAVALAGEFKIDLRPLWFYTDAQQRKMIVPLLSEQKLWELVQWEEPQQVAQNATKEQQQWMRQWFDQPDRWVQKWKEFLNTNDAEKIQVAIKRIRQAMSRLEGLADAVLENNRNCKEEISNRYIELIAQLGDKLAELQPDKKRLSRQRQSG